MALQFRTAQRKKVRLKVGISAPSGAGKTMSSLLFAYGLVKGEHPEFDDETIWSKIAVIDSENGSGEMYSNYKIKNTDIAIGEYNVITIEPPFTAEKYIEAINMCESYKMEVCIIDSMTHLWNGVGSLLEKQGNVAKRTGNSYTAWREVTPIFNRFVDTMLQTNMHVIATMRAKTEYVQEKGSDGKVSIRKVGLAPVFRDGIEYEFSLFMDIDTEHQAHVTKDRTGVLDDEYFIVTPKEGERIARWISTGAEMKENPSIRKSDSSNSNDRAQEGSKIELEEALSQIDGLAKTLGESGVPKQEIADAVKKHFVINGKHSANYNAIEDINVANKVIKELESICNK